MVTDADIIAVTVMVEKDTADTVVGKIPLFD